MTKRLTQLEPNEVSLVPVGANQKRFLVVKEQSSGDRFLAKVLKAFGKKDDSEETINEKLDGLSPAAQTAARAIARIAAPHADELTGDHIDSVLSEAGIGEGSEEDSETGSEGGSSTVKAEHKKSAKDAAEKAYKSEMEKLGYKKYPAAELTMKAFGEDEDDEDEDDADEKKRKAEKARKEKEDEDSAEKAKKEKTMKEFVKADGSVDFEAISKSADADPVMVAIAKGMLASNARAVAAETALAETQKVLKEQKDGVAKAEIVRKSFEFKNLSQPAVQHMLEVAQKAGAEDYEKIVKSLEAQNAQMGQSGLFQTIGKSGQSDGAMSAWGKIEKAAEGIVQKSAEKISKEQGIAAFLETSEGQALYAQHQAARPNGI